MKPVVELSVWRVNSPSLVKHLDVIHQEVLQMNPNMNDSSNVYGAQV